MVARTSYVMETLAAAGMAEHAGEIVVVADDSEASWVQCRCGFAGTERLRTDLAGLVSKRKLERLDFSRHLRAVHRRAIGAKHGRSIALDGPDLTAPIAELLSVYLAQAYLTNPLNRLSQLVRRVKRQTQRSVGDLHPRLWPIADAALTATLRAGVHVSETDRGEPWDWDLVAAFGAWLEEAGIVGAEIEALGEPPHSPRARQEWDAVRADVEDHAALHAAAAQRFLDADRALQDATASITDPALTRTLADIQQEDTETAAVDRAAARIQAIRKRKRT